MYIARKRHLDNTAFMVIDWFMQHERKILLHRTIDI